MEGNGHFIYEKIIILHWSYIALAPRIRQNAIDQTT